MNWLLRISQRVLALFLVSLPLFAQQAPAVRSGGENIWFEYLKKWGINFGWIIIATLGFSLALGLGYKIFDLFSKGIDESEELKKRNVGVAIIISVFIFTVALLVSKVIGNY